MCQVQSITYVSGRSRNRPHSIRTDDCGAERVRICGSKQHGRTATSKALVRATALRNLYR